MSGQAHVILIDNYDSFTWNLYHFLGDLGAETVVHRNDKISVGQVMSARPEAIVISPGPGVPSQAGIIIDLIKEASGKIPVFGVCLGLAGHWRGFWRRRCACADPDAWQALQGSSPAISACSRACRRTSTPRAIIRSWSTAPPCRRTGSDRRNRWPHHGAAAQRQRMCMACSSTPRALPPNMATSILKNFLDMAGVKR